MSTLSLRLPESLHHKIRELAERDEVSLNQFIAMAVAEKAAALLTLDYLEERGQRGSVELFDRVLARVPDVAPIAADRERAAVYACDLCTAHEHVARRVDGNLHALCRREAVLSFFITLVRRSDER